MPPPEFFRQVSEQDHHHQKRDLSIYKVQEILLPSATPHTISLIAMLLAQTRSSVFFFLLLSSFCCRFLPMMDDKTVPLVSPNDLPVLQGSYRFDGCNYLQWSQLVCTTLKGRKKLNHLEGNPLATTDPKYEAWDDEDALIMT
ncbi:uncharacterized protein DS421_20g702460 [Arachis hypogaea]|nr:uncharacterized protein DS421_20g702460 [Arachis hypogaea]